MIGRSYCRATPDQCETELPEDFKREIEPYLDADKQRQSWLEIARLAGVWTLIVW